MADTAKATKEITQEDLQAAMAEMKEATAEANKATAAANKKMKEAEDLIKDASNSVVKIDKPKPKEREVRTIKVSAKK